MAAGFTPTRKTYKLKFEGDLEGLEVRATSVPLGEFLALTRMAAAFEGRSPEDFGVEDLGAVEGLIDGFTQALRDWNVLDDDGEQVPPTAAGVRTQEFDFVLQIITAWIEAVAAVSAPLVPNSTAGKLLAEGSIPMVPLSGARAS